MQVVRPKSSRGWRAVFRPWHRGAIYIGAFVVAGVMIFGGGPGSTASQFAWVPLIVAAVLGVAWSQGRTVDDLTRAVRGHFHHRSP